MAAARRERSVGTAAAAARAIREAKVKKCIVNWWCCGAWGAVQDVIDEPIEGLSPR